ncbi:hypothetical protein DL771_005227 [Monosporascus sp. 5C6A]|nr:hypothetical protein DL771_005227 [Monosporascus sp. 5C6A]
MNQPESEVAAKCSNPRCETASSDQLPLCAGCKQARYCTKACQKEDWKDHKLFCKHVASNGANSASLDPMLYYQKIAPYDPKAKSLASDIGLALPGPNDEFPGFAMLMRRLVVTGRDTPENLSLLFGQNKAGQLDECHKDTRLEVLLRPPPGSPMYVMAKSMGYDENCPPWTPREPSATEAQKIKEIRDMQETIRRHMGSRGVSNITSGDMREILVSNFGNRWSQVMKVYQDAVNAMDQGVGL